MDSLSPSPLAESESDSPRAQIVGGQNLRAAGNSEVTPARAPHWAAKLVGDAALAIAVEHCRWARRSGQTPAMVFEGLGITPASKDIGGRAIFLCPTWDDAVWLVAALCPVGSAEDAGDDAMGWFRSNEGAPTDAKWLVVAKRAEARPIEVAAVWWALLDYASQHQERGSVAGFDTEALALFFGVEEDRIAAIVAVMRQRRLIVDDHIASWARYQPRREDPTSTERSRRSRAKLRDSAQRDAAGRNATQGDATYIQTNKQTERGEPPKPPLRRGATPLSEEDFPPEWFAEAADARALAKLAPIDLVHEAAKFRVHFAGKRRAVWRREFVMFMLRARGAPGAERPPDVPPAVRSAETAELDLRQTWGRPPDWWRRFDPTQRTRARMWVDTGRWRASGDPPGGRGCNLDPELAAAAVAERTRRLSAQPEMLLPIAGAGDPAAAQRGPEPRIEKKVVAA